MAEKISNRKREHLELSLTDKVLFRQKTTGFERYDFVHCAVTEVDISQINLETKFFGKNIALPYMISCMTGGTDEANNINKKLAESAKTLNIPLGLGSLRYAIETDAYDHLIEEIAELASPAPIVGNIGIAQVCKNEGIDKLKKLVQTTGMTAMAVHFNPAQELFQPEGEWNFSGLRKAFRNFCELIEIPVIAKEVGSGISGPAAHTLLKNGAKAIDTAGAGGTSWTAIEFLRSKEEGLNQEIFHDWGIPTADSLHAVHKLKLKKKFLLIASGGINDPLSSAKAIALGADMTASARSALIALEEGGADGVTALFNQWGDILKKIMYLTGSHNLKQFRKDKIYRTERFS